MITEILKNRFDQNMIRHPDLDWGFIEARLNENKEALEALKLMEDISLFVEENTEAEIIDEEREIR